MAGLVGGWMARWMDRWSGGWMNCQIWIEGLLDGWIGQINRWVLGWME